MPRTRSKPRTSEKAAAKPQWRNRIVDSADVDPHSLTPHPMNWRPHGPEQRAALANALEEIGVVGRVIVNRRTGNMVDGHLRLEMALARGQETIPVDYVDLDEDEERAVLATFDPIAALAGTDRDKLANVLAGITEERARALGDLIANVRDVTTLGKPPNLGPEIDESIADTVALCTCRACGHEHHRVKA